ncbi:MAG: AAA family ATPase, partial [Thermoplasmata archaeon]
TAYIEKLEQASEPYIFFLRPRRFGKSLFVSPPEELKNKNNIRKLFKKAGFKNIKIKEKKKLFTKYYFITAEK